MIRTKSQKYCEAVEFILGNSMVSFLYPSLPLPATGVLWVSHSSLSPYPIRTYSKENYPSWKWTFPRYILQGLAPSFLSQILNCHSSALLLSLPPTSALDILSCADPIVPLTHYTLSIYSVSTYSQYLKCPYLPWGSDKSPFVFKSQIFWDYLLQKDSSKDMAVIQVELHIFVYLINSNTVLTTLHLFLNIVFVLDWKGARLKCITPPCFLL